MSLHFSVVMEQFTFFWSRHSPFSNWHPSVFFIDEKKYLCNEQFYMHCKAMYFNDNETAIKIMETSNPAVMKRLGRQVKGFDQKEWDKVSRDIMRQGVEEKVILWFFNFITFEIFFLCSVNVLVSAKQKLT